MHATVVAEKKHETSTIQSLEKSNKTTSNRYHKSNTDGIIPQQQKQQQQQDNNINSNNKGNNKKYTCETSHGAVNDNDDNHDMEIDQGKKKNNGGVVAAETIASNRMSASTFSTTSTSTVKLEDGRSRSNHGENGNIKVEPYHPSNVNPLSIDVKTETSLFHTTGLNPFPSKNVTNASSNSSNNSNLEAQNPPVLRGTLSYSEDERKHYIRGNWNYEKVPQSVPQRFELSRNLSPEEDVKDLIRDGEFSGSFTLLYVNPKQKERTKVVKEKNVKIKFTKIQQFNQGDTDNNNNIKTKASYRVDGTGINEYGIFHIKGTAKASPFDDGQYQVELRKTYEPQSQKSVIPQTDKKKMKKKKKTNPDTFTTPVATEEDNSDALPEPSKIYEQNVVCLRGNMSKEHLDELTGVGAESVVTRITGLWANALDVLLADPDNIQGQSNRFEYEHKSSSNNGIFPVSGRYTGWFFLNDLGGKKKIPEKDVTLRFRKNNKGYYNVEGKGSNYFGKYTITGTLSQDNVITIFRHFLPVKVKSRPVTSAPPPINAPGETRRTPVPIISHKHLSLDDVKTPPAGDGPLEVFTPPATGAYSAVSRGVFRVDEDGAHASSGKWAVITDHLDLGQQCCQCKVRLEPHFVEEAIKRDPSRKFPVDSDMYKGSFQLKKQGGGSRQQTVVDTQIVMKFRQNTQGTFNVYGKGVNSIGVFNLTGLLLSDGSKPGNVVLYRSYPPELLASQPPTTTNAITRNPTDTHEAPMKSNTPMQSAFGILPPPPRPGSLVRRESTRTVKVPSRLEDDDPEAQLSRLMDKCGQALRLLRTKDRDTGNFFSAPVDPIRLGIPNYYDIITEPMDLHTLQARMDNDLVRSPEEFARLGRLVFENAMKFNVDPAHPVHVAARNLLVFFNQKMESIEQQLTAIRRADGDERKKGKGDKKRKREEELKSPRRRRFEEASEMAHANAVAMSALISAAPTGSTVEVTRNEFSLVLQMISKLQQQVVQTYKLIADLSSDDPSKGNPESSVVENATSETAPPPSEKKRVKKKAEPVKSIERPAIVEDDNSPLSTEEQQFLEESIPHLPDESMHDLVKIVRESTTIANDAEEIELEIQALDSKTQRKLLKYVSKILKVPKNRKRKAETKPKAASSRQKKPPTKKAERKESPLVAKSRVAAPANPKPSSLFSFQTDQSDSESDDGEVSEATPPPSSTAASAAAAAPVAGAKGFRLGAFGVDNDDDDDDDDDDDGASTGEEIATNWNMSRLETVPKKKDGDEDDAWGAAREEALAAKAREEDKKKREAKLKAEAEQQKNQRLAEAVAHGEEIKAQRQAEEEEEARLREEKERAAEEERIKARENARKQVQSVEQTVDFDDQRDLMKQLEQDYMDSEMGGASPSSDFGF